MALRVFAIKKYILTVRTLMTGLDINLFLWDTPERRLFPLNLRLSLPPGRPHELPNVLSVTKLREKRKRPRPRQKTHQSLLIMEVGELEKHAINIEEALLMF